LFNIHIIGAYVIISGYYRVEERCGAPLQTYIIEVKVILLLYILLATNYEGI